MGSTVKNLKGQLLLDGGNLQGSFFHRTVVLICQHDANGAFGLVLNKAADSKLGEVVEMTLPERVKELPLYLGGPVQAGVLSFLHTDQYLPDANVLPNLSLGHAIEQLQELGESYSSTLKLRVFAGYAGWSAGQLEEEMKRDAWLTHPATVELVFESDPAKLWKDILRQKDWKQRLLADGPDDPAVN